MADLLLKLTAREVAHVYVALRHLGRVPPGGHGFIAADDFGHHPTMTSAELGDLADRLAQALPDETSTRSCSAMSDAVEIKTSISFSLHQVVDLLVTGLESPYSPWLGQRAYTVTPAYQPAEPGWPKYAHPEFWAAGGEMEFRFDGENDREGTFASKKAVKLADLQAGLQTMAEKYPSHFGDFIQDEADAETGDVFLQLIMLGEIVYG